MKVLLNQETTIKSKLYEPGETIIVRKDVGERLIKEGLANRIIGEVDNRTTVSLGGRGDRNRFHSYKTF